MRAAIVRAIAVAAVTMAALGTAYVLQQSVWCPFNRTAAARGGSGLILDDGFSVARPGDAIFACESEHCPSPFGCHDDYTCQCAPAGLGALAVGAQIGGRCTVDKLQPREEDDAGACRHARCDDHLDGPSR